MHNVEYSAKPYWNDPHFDIENYFKYSLGIYHYIDKKPEIVKLEFYEYFIETIQNHPLMPTQKSKLTKRGKALEVELEVNNLKGKMNINVNTEIYYLVILLVILLEILAPVIIVYHCITGEYTAYSNYAIVSLIIFTILATLLYHPLDITNYYKSIPFWANISLIGGLLLLLKD